MAYETINLDLALEQLGGSIKLYGTVVKGFWEKYSHVDQMIQDLIDQGSMEEARRLAHSIKGLCGNLGATKLRERALELEMAIRDNLDTVTPMKAFAQSLSLTKQDIKAILEAYYE